MVATRTSGFVPIPRSGRLVYRLIVMPPRRPSAPERRSAILGLAVVAACPPLATGCGHEPPLASSTGVAATTTERARARPHEAAEPASESTSARGAATGPDLARAMPIRVVADVPAWQPGRSYFNATVDRSGGSIVLTGCRSSAPEACDKTWRLALDDEHTRELDRRWSTVASHLDCQPRAAESHGRGVRIEFITGRDLGRIVTTWPPAGSPSPAPESADPCASGGELARWLAFVSPEGGLHQP